MFCATGKVVQNELMQTVSDFHLFLSETIYSGRWKVGATSSLLFMYGIRLLMVIEVERWETSEIAQDAFAKGPTQWCEWRERDNMHT
jgi:hypothetical protein